MTCRWRILAVLAALLVLSPAHVFAQGMSDRSLQRSVANPEQFSHFSVGLTLSGQFAVKDQDAGVGWIEDGDEGLDLSVSGWSLGGGVHLPIGNRSPSIPIAFGMRLGATLEGMTLKGSHSEADFSASETWFLQGGYAGPAITYHVQDIGLSIMLSGTLGVGLGFTGSAEFTADLDDDDDLNVLFFYRPSIELALLYQPGPVGGILTFGHSFGRMQAVEYEVSYRTATWNVTAGVLF